MQHQGAWHRHQCVLYVRVRGRSPYNADSTSCSNTNVHMTWAASDSTMRAVAAGLPRTSVCMLLSRPVPMSLAGSEVASCSSYLIVSASAFLRLGTTVMLCIEEDPYASCIAHVSIRLTCCASSKSADVMSYQRSKSYTVPHDCRLQHVSTTLKSVTYVNNMPPESGSREKKQTRT